MALFSLQDRKTLYSEYGNGDDYCTYCEKEIKERANKKEITHDEYIKEVKKLIGKLKNIKIAKMRYYGHETCICPECLRKIMEEVLPEVTLENASEVTTEEKNKTKTDKKAAKNEKK